MTPMSFPPPLPPPTLDYMIPGEAHSKAREIALAQRAMIRCLLACVTTFGLLMLAMIRNGADHYSWLVAGLTCMAFWVLSIGYCFRLARATYDIGVAILSLILCLVPTPISLFVVMAVVSSRATELLKKEGLSVGLLGVGREDIPA